ncbi:unnamed protein product [Haemonchus placei]|uniref:Uncharacterized protein n=1 Tax=Haemonchus placei TaxID=6290 RepID=A0A0N4WPM3_HAEPC|nr:unnamed protein product [Haemonchus placei]
MIPAKVVCKRSYKKTHFRSSKTLSHGVRWVSSFVEAFGSHTDYFPPKI